MGLLRQLARLEEWADGLSGVPWASPTCTELAEAAMLSPSPITNGTVDGVCLRRVAGGDMVVFTAWGCPARVLGPTIPPGSIEDWTANISMSPTIGGTAKRCRGCNNAESLRDLSVSPIVKNLCVICVCVCVCVRPIIKNIYEICDFGSIVKNIRVNSVAAQQ